MNMRLFLFLLSLVCTPAFAQSSSENFSLEKVVDLAVRNSPAVLGAEQEVGVAKLHVRDARFMYWPQITLSGTATKLGLDYPMVSGAELGDRFLSPAYDNDFFTLRAQVLQTIYSGGRNKNNLKSAKAAHDRAKVNYDSVRSLTAYKAKKAFYALLYQRKLLALNENCIKKLQILDNSIKKDKFEQIESSLLLSSVTGKRAEIFFNEKTASYELLRLISREPLFTVILDEDFEINPIKETLQQSLVTAIEKRPELKSEIYQAQIDDIAVNMAMVRHYPTVTVGATYDINAERISDLTDSSIYEKNWVTMLSVRLPISYDVWSLVSQRRIQQRQGELKRVELREAVRAEIMSTYKEAEFWQKEYERITADLEKYEKIYKSVPNSSKQNISSFRTACLLCDVKRQQLHAIYMQLESRVKLEWARGLDFPK